MSHNVNYSVYAENVNKDRVQAEWDAVARVEGRGEGASGLPEKIRWHSPIMDSEKEAEEYISRHDSGWYAQLAVRFRVSNAQSAKIAGAKERLSLARGKFQALNQKPHFANTKAGFIGCKNCGSRIAAKYLKGNFCPVCRADMRPETVLKKLKGLSANIEKAQKAYDEAVKTEAKKSKTINWLVKTEYHT